MLGRYGHGRFLENAGRRQLPLQVSQLELIQPILGVLVFTLLGDLLHLGGEVPDRLFLQPQGLL